MTRVSAIVIVLMVVALSVFSADASALSCCRKYTKGKVPMHIIKGYSIQYMTRNCHINAVIFHTNGGKNICTDPTKDWVMDGIRKLRDKVQAISKKHSKV
ncbi:C-C motif chemokine 20a.3 [Ctenopharyngodon idella]|uniref:Chemokine ligand 20a n=1 Tax=Ctenopharyngodon idella TaxID=7959 RepID=A0A345D6Z8_CTEID|nr:C-C motif chemokine 20a.3 [Ctenopharyngodon idella]AXF84128.1 chemokine ligand 20a [Ctenopharyngodon idella]